MAFDWFDSLADADSYFEDERYITDHWDALTDTQKTKLITNAYNWIFYSDRFNGNMPTKAQATAVELIVLKKAQGECCYFLAEHLYDIDTRKGLQAQAVLKAGIVKEEYDSDKLYDHPFPQIVLSWLGDYDKYKRKFRAIEIGRDDEEDVNADLGLND